MKRLSAKTMDHRFRRLSVIRSLTDRFFEKVDRNGAIPLHNPSLGSCWLWMAYILPNGYGHISVGPAIAGKIYAHRASYVIHKGAIENGMDIDHLCRNRKCVNPNHLEAVTRRTNLVRGETVIASNLAKTHCPQGHPYDDVNTYLCRGHRQCKICRVNYDKNRQPRKSRQKGRL